MPDIDFIHDVFDRIDAALDKPLPRATRRKLETELRTEWAGDRVYIGQDTDVSRIFMSMRDRCICRDHHRGESVALIARRYGISRQRVYQILHRNQAT